MRNSMNVINILFGIVLMILVLVQTYNSVKAESYRQELQQLCDFLKSRKDTMDSLISRFDSILCDMASDNEKNAVLKNHAREMENLVKELKNEQFLLESGNRSMKKTRKRLLTNKEKLINETNEIKGKIRQRKDTIAQLDSRIDTLKRIKAGLDIDMDENRAEEIGCLSEPLSYMDIPPMVKTFLESQGIRCVGEVACLDRDYFRSIKGVGPVSIGRIEEALREKGLCLGMDAVKVNDRWYRIEHEETVEDAIEHTQERTQERTSE